MVSGIVGVLGLIFVVLFATDCCSATSKVVSSEVNIMGLSVVDFNKNHKNGVLIDIRTPEEFASGNLEGSLNLDFYSSTFRADLDSLDKNGVYFIYCRSGSRTSQTKIIMRSLGFKNVYDLNGGILAWSSAGLPLSY